MKYSGIDLHSNNSVVVVSDEADRVLVRRRVANDAAAILALGAVSLFVFPLIGRALGMSDHAYGLWVGLALWIWLYRTRTGMVIDTNPGMQYRCPIIPSGVESFARE